ncbi:hypothetical protein FZZ93_15245 [Halomonas eurihalina]|uniref:DUF945 domain-containing protein n=1 Tax=Halomonas eurihalina TaxID=42566 RepID=A0A5D9CQD7_HALER|nr:hypothetical protein [Halomonas eurihalina]MDR5860835.1 hypothetical protein [Halomonas eurihalina]TZG33804.1 hypothetical protein FZZ93_15245 [Halomonas eurihalina]
MRLSRTFLSRLALAMALSVPLAGPALADAEKFEADLRALFADRPGELTIGEVSESLLGGETRAKDLEYVSERGERVQVDRYVVEGNYDDPDQVVLEGLKVTEEEDGQTGTITARRLVVVEPSRPVLSPRGVLADDLEAAELTAEGLVIERNGRTVLDAAGETPRSVTNPRLTVEHLDVRDIAPTTIGSLEATDIAGSGEAFGEIGDGEFTLGTLNIKGLRDLNSQAGARADRVELKNLDIEAQRLAATLDRLLVDGDMADGAGSLRLESLDLDLARMIELAPAEERTRLRMMSNVLTGGNGHLALDAAFDGQWEALDDTRAMLLGESRVTAADAFRWTLDSETPARLPEGVDPSTYFAEVDGLDDVTLLGGEIETTLTDLGLFGRLPAVIATSQGMSEDEFMAQARTQAKGLGSLFGPEFATLFGGLVDMMEGKASELVVHFTLPEGDEQELDALADDPLVLPSKLSMQVHTR